MLFRVLRLITTQEALENAVLAYCREAEREGEEVGRQNVVRQPFRYCCLLIIHRSSILSSLHSLHPSLHPSPLSHSDQ